jgi:hypothetical protein
MKTLRWFTRNHLLSHLRIASALTLMSAGAATAFVALNGDPLVSAGSPPSPFSQNKQNEPALAVDANHPNVLVAGANDNIDLEACNAGDDTTCPFTPGVGTSGVYFSFDSGRTWTQPTYSGYSARFGVNNSCLGVVGPDPGCTPDPNGLIGTLPWYYENGLVSDGDPALAFGPKPDSSGHFSWANGSRLYYANLTANLNAKRDETFKGFEAIYVSRTDDVATAALGSTVAARKSAWKTPVRVSAQSSATFADKEQIWADNASSSPFFGNCYVCWENFIGSGAGALDVATSRDGGDTWSQKQVTPAYAVPPKMWGQSGCTIRTDSNGVVYLFYEQFQSPFTFLPPHGTHFLVKSFDGGVSWTRPTALYTITDPCFVLNFDGNVDRCVEDGVAGARNDLSASPSVSIANGAPTGAGATNEIVNSWADGRDGVNHEHVMFAYSNAGGDPGTWTLSSIETAGDRGYYAAPAISPSGSDVYVVYNAFTTPFRNDTTSPRSLVGVVKHASIPTSGLSKGAVGPFTELQRGAPGDPRGSSQNNLWLEFLGDYVYAVATDTYGAAVWNDTRNAADCPAIDAWRQEAQDAIANGTAVPTKPAPEKDCEPTFGNSDIFGWTSAP